MVQLPPPTNPDFYKYGYSGAKREAEERSRRVYGPEVKLYSEYRDDCRCQHDCEKCEDENAIFE